MDSDEDFFQDDPESESSEYDDLPMEMENAESSAQEKQEEEDFQYEVLTADQIVQYMVDCIKEVNSVVQVLTKPMHVDDLTSLGIYAKFTPVSRIII